MKSLSHDNAGAERSFVFVLRSFTVANMFVLEESNNQRKFYQSHFYVRAVFSIVKSLIDKMVQYIIQTVLE